MPARVGERAPNLQISEWIQGMPTNLDQERDKVVLVEVFQVNCPGCFMYGIPSAMDIYRDYADDGVRVLGLATAFEDYDKNTAENLKMLAETGQVIGDTLDTLGRYGQLDQDRLRYKIPFPLAMDAVTRSTGGAGQQQVMDLIHSQIPDFDSHPMETRERVIRQAGEYLNAKEYSAGTFESYALRGTPSTILVDRRGILRDVSFGQGNGLESMVRKLISE